MEHKHSNSRTHSAYGDGHFLKIEQNRMEQRLDYEKEVKLAWNVQGKKNMGQSLYTSGCM